MSEARPRLSDEELLERFRTSKNHAPSAVLLGAEVLALSQDEQWVEIAFNAQPTFCNPLGRIQGGFVSAMLDHALSIAGNIASQGTQAMLTLEMSTTYLSAAMPGRLIARGRVVRFGRHIAFLEGDLRDESGKICAKASITAMPLDFKRAKPADESGSAA